MRRKDEIQNLSCEVSEESIFFSVDGKRRFKMDLGQWRGLIDRDNLRESARGAHAADKEKDFSDLGIKEYVTAFRLLKKGMGLSQAADVMGIPFVRLRSYFNYAREKYSLNQGSVVEELRRQTEEGRDYAKVKKPLTRGLPPDAPDSFSLVDLGKVKSLVNAGMEPFAIAEKFNLDADDFKEWFRVNEPLLAAFK